MKITDFAPGTSFLEIFPDVPVAREPGKDPFVWSIGKPTEMSRTSSMHLDMATPVSFEEFKLLVSNMMKALGKTQEEIELTLQRERLSDE